MITSMEEREQIANAKATLKIVYLFLTPLIGVLVTIIVISARQDAKDALNGVIENSKINARQDETLRSISDKMSDMVSLYRDINKKIDGLIIDKQ